MGHEPVPRAWFPGDLAGQAVLCLASGDGQQGPVLAAAGAAVTDIAALERDELVVRYKLPFSSLDLPRAEQEQYRTTRTPRHGTCPAISLPAL